MSNTLTDIMPKILARGLLALREQALMPRLVNGSYSAEAAEKGDTIDVPIPTANAATDVTPSNTPSAPTDTTPSKVQIALNNWKKVNFHMSDKDMVEVDKNNHFIPMQMSEAVRALANVVNVDIHNEYVGVYGFTGTAGSTPFASTVVDAVNARKVLHQQRAPRTERRGVLDFDAEANALALPPFADAEKTLSAQVKIEGEIGRKYGVDWVADDAVVTHTAGSLQATGALVGSTTAAGTITLDVASASAVGNLVIGDVFTIAGDTQTYAVGATVSAIASSANSAVTISPALATAATSGAAITIKASHVVNMVFHRDAFAFANRPLVSSTQDTQLGSMIMSMTDPQTGITLRLEISRQYKQVVWELDILWGAKLVRPELACRVAG
jgi:hypothetical protein